MKTRQIATENTELGISSLPDWIKFCQCLLRLSFRLDIKEWSVKKADRHVMDTSKKEVEESFRYQMGLLVDAPKPSFGITNEGNTTRILL
ncbi:hypothetical protein TNCT_127971 [Trichonephila clavata]|uniref:Uncharacterized protein n=1 Tax=Trichonephila clavata TaxID=2740835 RepID=A0A8X6G6G4_TRICU|nr:hypothetical protein TNCT_127971 [Trichonephila clavata]